MKEDVMIFDSVLHGISSYEAGKPIELVVREFGIEPKDIIKLASNENPYGASQKVLDSLVQNISSLSMYPDDSYIDLKISLAKKFDVLSEQITIGAGSDQLIEFCLRSIRKETNCILTAGTTFAMYEIYANMCGMQSIKTKSNTHNLNELYKEYITKKPDVIFLCVPNNPLGECLSFDDICEFIEKIDVNTMVVIDGAYQEYASFKDESKKINVKYLISTFYNVIYLGTFSKAYGLGGMRVGYAIAHEDTTVYLHKLRAPFNITTLSLRASIEALKDDEHIQNTVSKNFEEMKKYENFCKNNNIDYLNSYTNFITLMLDDNLSSTDISNMLLKEGVIVRNLSQYNLNAIRITIGHSFQNDIVLEKLNNIISESNQ